MENIMVATIILRNFIEIFYLIFFRLYFLIFYSNILFYIIIDISSLIHFWYLFLIYFLIFLLISFSDISSDIFSDIFFDILSDIFSDNFLIYLLRFLLIFFWYFLNIFLISYLISSIDIFFWYPSQILFCVLFFWPVNSSWGPALPTLIVNFPVGAQLPTAIWSSLLRSGAAHCDLQLAVEIRRCPLQHTAGEDNNEDDNKRKWFGEEGGRRGRSRTALIKSKKPYLIGDNKIYLI